MNIFDNIDRELMNKIFKYNVCFFILLLVIFFGLLFIKVNYYYHNSISFIDSRNALIIVDKDNINSIKNINEIILDNLEIHFNIGKIEEIESTYVLNIVFDSDLNLKIDKYRINLGKKSLLEYFIYTMKGD
jgi:hypothetical protein